MSTAEPVLTPGPDRPDGTAQTRQPIRVLVGQRDQLLGEVLVRHLTASQMSVRLVATAADALDRAGLGVYDVIVLDDTFDDADGFTTCQRLRAESITTPVMFLAAANAVEDRIGGFRAGADDYLGKPFSIRELIARLTVLGRRVDVPPQTILRCGDLALDCLAHRARRGEAIIALTRREFELLRVLMRDPDVVVSREELLRRVWGQRHPGPDNVVDVYVGYLRRKIDRPFGRRSLQTVRGAGYRITAQA